MTVTYADRGVGTMTCDRGCGAAFHDGVAEAEAGLAGLIHVRAGAAGWKFVRPNEHEQDDVCPACPRERPYARPSYR